MSAASKNAEKVRKLALAIPDAVEGTSCNNATFAVRGKNFLFLGCKEETYDLRIRLSDSLTEAEELAKDGPGKISVGAHGWTHIVLAHTEALPQTVLKRWISESFAMLVPQSAAKKNTTKTVKKKATKKKSAKKTVAIKRAVKSKGKKTAKKKP